MFDIYSPERIIRKTRVKEYPMRFRTLAFVGNALRLLDQTKLPRIEQYVECTTVSDVFHAIRGMVVRGAPAIGVAAAYAMVLAAKGTESNSRDNLLAALAQTADYLKSCRPTAINLAWAVDQMMNAAENSGLDDCEKMAALLETVARAIEDEDRLMCERIGRNGEPLIPDGSAVLTHCNAGALATAGIGTALGVLYTAHDKGKKIHVFVDETRPLWQGARLTAWELQQEGIEVTVLCDHAAASLFAAGKIDAVIVGADRITQNGDVANKIGTYNLAVLAEKHGVPFYVAAPQSTFDPHLASGEQIPIEMRAPEEVIRPNGILVAPEGTRVYSPAFDVTPNSLITAIITDTGIRHGSRRAN